MASANSGSTAGAKCDPKTSAVVVPARPGRETKSAATEAAYDGSASRASSGSAHRSSQSSSGMPRPPIDPDLREVHVGVDEARQHQPAGQVDDLLVVGAGRSAATAPRAMITPSRTSGPRRSRRAARRL